MPLQPDREYQRRLPRVWDSYPRKGWDMRRKLFNFVALVSLLLCVATVVLWVRSSVTEDFISRFFVGREFFVYWDGSLKVRRYTKFLTPQSIEVPDSFNRVDPRMAAWSAARATKQQHFWGFRMEESHLLDGGGNAGYTYEFDKGISKTFVIPVWFLLITTATLPTLWMTRRLRMLGHDVHPECPCGYNLTGNISGVCPECGTAVVGRAGA
jgi:hypothetical protein